MHAENINLTIRPNARQSILSFDIYDADTRIDRVNIGGIHSDLSDNPTAEEVRDIVEIHLRDREVVAERRQQQEDELRVQADTIDSLSMPDVVTKTSAPTLDVTSSDADTVAGSSTGNVVNLEVDGESVGEAEVTNEKYKFSGLGLSSGTYTAKLTAVNRISGRDFDSVEATETMKVDSVESLA